MTLVHFCTEQQPSDLMLAIIEVPCCIYFEFSRYPYLCSFKYLLPMARLEVNCFFSAKLLFYIGLHLLVDKQQRFEEGRLRFLPFELEV